MEAAHKAHDEFKMNKTEAGCQGIAPTIFGLRKALKPLPYPTGDWRTRQDSLICEHDARVKQQGTLEHGGGWPQPLFPPPQVRTILPEFD